MIEEHSEAKVDLVNKTIAHVLTARELAVVPIDTRLDTNETGLRTPREIETSKRSMFIRSFLKADIRQCSWQVRFGVTK